MSFWDFQRLPLQSRQSVLIAALQRLARPARDANELALPNHVLRSNAKLDAVVPVESIPVRVADLERGVGADELGVDLVDQDGEVQLVRV